MKKYLIFAIILILSLSLFACGETKTPEKSTPTTEATTTEAPKTERAPEVVVNMAEVPEAATPNERFADHPALALWDDVSLIPSYAEFENIPCFVPYLSEGDGGLIILVQGTSDDGAYYENEGAPVAEYLNSLGYDVLICKYRPTDAYTAAEDIRRAVALALYTASDFGVTVTSGSELTANETGFDFLIRSDALNEYFIPQIKFTTLPETFQVIELDLNNTTDTAVKMKLKIISTSGISVTKEIGLTANTARTVEVLNELADGSKIASVCITFENQQEVNGSFVMIEDRTIQVLGMRIR